MDLRSASFSSLSQPTQELWSVLSRSGLACRLGFSRGCFATPIKVRAVFYDERSDLSMIRAIEQNLP
jgi:hypothetical protein